ncbi:hypothetical protein PsYK624_163600 [Phanerochaete sordida]|uniref:F-box domain-containing protein n=1 Tax=Phanerochaete sordida TaxID=48140 RepID=A0A9P3GVP7_9APHY|nr:hypothetical protein PsYK624_163600 [Phanerochaete sordida]
MAASQKTDISSLSPKLLEHIFLIATLALYESTEKWQIDMWHARRFLAHHGNPRDPLVLCSLRQVCKRWDQIVLSCPELWNYMNSYEHSAAWMQRSLQRSAGTPLCVAGTSTELAYVVKLCTSEAHRIKSLLFSPVAQTAIESDPSIAFSADFPQLKDFKLELPCAAGSPWLSLLARAPNLTVLNFVGTSRPSDLLSLASTLPFTGLKTLAIKGMASSKHLDVDATALLALLRRLPNLENVLLKGINLIGEDRATPDTKEISLPHLRDLQVLFCSTSIFHVLQSIAIPRGTHIDVQLIHVDPQHSEAFLDFMTRVGAAMHDAGTLRSLQVALDGLVLRLLGHRSATPENEKYPDLRVEFWKLDPLGADAGAFLATLMSRACARLHLASLRTLTLGADNDRWEPHALFTGLRPTLAGLAHVQELRVEGLLSRLTTAAVADLLTTRHEGRAPLPALTRVLFDAADVCAGYHDAFFDALCALLLARWKLGAPVHRVVVRSEEEEVFTDAQKMVLRTARTTGMDSHRLVRHFVTENIPPRAEHAEALPVEKRTATRTRGRLCSCAKTAKGMR